MRQLGSSRSFPSLMVLGQPQGARTKGSKARRKRTNQRTSKRTNVSSMAKGRLRSKLIEEEFTDKLGKAVQLQVFKKYKVRLSCAGEESGTRSHYYTSSSTQLSIGRALEEFCDARTFPFVLVYTLQSLILLFVRICQLMCCVHLLPKHVYAHLRSPSKQ